MHCQLAASAQGKPVNRCNQRLAETSEGLPGRLARVVEDADQIAFGHFVDVGACGKGLGAAGDDHRVGVVIALRSVQFVGQFAKQLGGQGVQGLRALQGNQTHAGLDELDGKG